MKTKNIYGILWLLTFGVVILLLSLYLLGSGRQNSQFLGYNIRDFPNLNYVLFGLTAGLASLIIEYVLGNIFKNKLSFEKDNWIKKVKVFAVLCAICIAGYLLYFLWR